MLIDWKMPDSRRIETCKAHFEKIPDEVHADLDHGHGVWQEEARTAGATFPFAGYLTKTVTTSSLFDEIHQGSAVLNPKHIISRKRLPS